MPLSTVSVDEHNVAGGCSLLLLRRLALAKATGAPLEDAFKAWMAEYRREIDPDLVDLAVFETVASDAGRPTQTCRLFNLSFAYELPLYKALLQADLEAMPAAHGNSAEVTTPSCDIHADVTLMSRRRYAVVTPSLHWRHNDQERSSPKVTPRAAPPPHARRLSCAASHSPTVEPHSRPPPSNDQARRVHEVLVHFRALPLEWVPPQSLVSTFCGGAWLQ